MKLETARLAALSRLFSSSVFKEMAEKGRSPLFARLASQSFTVAEKASLESVREAFDYALRRLQVGGNRDEYVYKAAITRRVLLGRHSLRSACMLSEFRIGQCKADLVILNGTATVYEIKSERDSLSRLEKQIAAYRTVFPKCFVVAGENHVDSVANSIPEDVGVLRLSPRQSLSTVREAVERFELVKPDAIFDAIRTDEALELLRRLGVAAPVVPNTQIRSALRQIFSRLAPVEIYPELLCVLKRFRDLSSHASFVERLPNSLCAVALTVRTREAQRSNLIAAVESPFNSALGWI